MPQWCIGCWANHHLRVEATRTIDDDPYCATCASAIERSDPPDEAEHEVSGGGTMSAGAGEDEQSEGALGASSPASSAVETFEASERFDDAVKQAFLPKPQKARGGKRMAGHSRVRKDVDWKMFDKLEREGRSRGEIAIAIGMSGGTLSRKVKEREATTREAEAPARPVRTLRRKPLTQPVPPEPTGDITVAVPEAAIDKFLTSLPIARKAELFTQELTAN